MKPGDVFNPWHEACGFYPSDAVLRQPGAVLTDGQKLLYQRLVRYAGQDGKCFPSQQTLAAELGKSERQIQRDIYRLEALKLIECQPRDGRRGNTYVFLWSSIFDAVDRTPMSAQTSESEPADADLTRHTCRLNESLTRQPCRLKPEQESDLTRHIGDLRRHPGQFETTPVSYYPIKNPSEKSSSSSPSSSENGPEDDELSSSEGKTQTHSPEDQKRFGKFMRGMIEPSPAEDPRDKLVAEILTRAPGWSVDEAIEALKINGTESRSTPKSYRWFLTVLENVFEKRGGIAPVIVRIEQCPHGQRIWRAHSRKYSDCWTCQNAFDEAAQRPDIACVRCMDSGRMPCAENLYTPCYCEAGRRRATENERLAS